MCAMSNTAAEVLRNMPQCNHSTAAYNPLYQILNEMQEYFEGTTAVSGMELTSPTITTPAVSNPTVTSSVVLVTDAAAYDVLAANSGKTHVILDLTQDTSIDLPAEAAGLFYKFIYAGGADDAHDHAIDTEDDTNFFIGGVAYADTNAGDAADEINAGIYSDGNSNSILTISNISAGTVVEVFCDGTNWYVSGRVFSDTAPAFTDQP
ncbi:MAG: hypothetical protein GY941_21655 [Planctomycetes bacterium]|nr:hypothetical protein [Planctomycetota bacterium]